MNLEKEKFCWVSGSPDDGERRCHSQILALGAGFWVNMNISMNVHVHGRKLREKKNFFLCVFEIYQFFFLVYVLAVKRSV